MTSASKKMSSLLMGAWALLGVYWRVRTFALREIWTDEIEQLRGVSKSLHWLLFVYLPGIPGGFPGDYLLTWPFAHLSTNKWILTAPHIPLMLLSFYLLFLICKAEFRTIWGPFVVFALFAMNPNLIFHALEIRPYASLLALVLAMYWVSFRAVQTDSWPMRRQIAWGIWCWFILLFHAYGLYLLVFLLTYHLIFSRGERPWIPTFKRFFIPTLIAGLLALPLWIYFANPDHISMYQYDTYLYSGGSARQLLAFVFGNLGDIGRHHAWIIPMVLIFFSLVLPDPKRSKRFGFLLLNVLCPIAFIYLSDKQVHYWFLQRQFIWVMPLWSILAGMSVESFAMLFYPSH